MHGRLEPLAYRLRDGCADFAGYPAGPLVEVDMGYVGSQGSAYRSSASLIRQANSGMTAGAHQDSVNQGLRSFG